ncbi:MAG: hypothetical protein IKN17_08610 [Ruminococcus sp.]|nr:hypothetical protein [Ruminococcus sp.]
MRLFGKLCSDYTNRCGNCHAFLGEDSFCRYCGTKRGEGKFEPYSDEPQCVYGPPPIPRVHNCKNCGFEWQTCMMIDYQLYCPKCGSRADMKEIHDKD